MDSERLEEWVAVSWAVLPFEPHLMPVVQMLGRLDCQLIQDEDRSAALPAELRGGIPESVRLTDRLGLSYLWILGAYELARTLHQRALHGSTLDAESIEMIAETKRAFARLRMPLAKMEPARAHRDTDSPIAFPAIHHELGVAWQVAPGEYITRRELANLLLNLLSILNRTKD